MIATWSAPLASGSTIEEQLLAFDEGRKNRVLIVPALFDEANKLRRFTIELMRALDRAGIDSFLPDLPGTNDSLANLSEQTLAGWRAAAQCAAEHVSATHILSLRGGALLAPSQLPGWRYAPITGAKLLRALLRTEVVAAREAGIELTSDDLLPSGAQNGVTLAGWSLGTAMLAELQSEDLLQAETQVTIDRSALPGSPLWLRAEPDEDAEQVAALGSIIASAFGDAG